MEDSLPTLAIRKEFNYINNITNHTRYSSSLKNKPNFPKNNTNYKTKSNYNNLNNFLRVTNTNKDEINSLKNTTGITFYNKFSFENKLKNNKNNNNMFETYYNNFKKNKEINQLTNNIKSYNSISTIRDNKALKQIPIHNSNLILPTFKVNNLNNKKLKLSNKVNNSSFNIDKTQQILGNYNSKRDDDNNPLSSYKKTDFQHILGKKNNLFSLDLIQNISFNKNKPQKFLSNDNKYLTALKTRKLFDNSSTKNRLCPLCHKEIENYRYRMHYRSHPSKIFNFLFLGSYKNACDKKEIKLLGINYVLNCAVECLESFPSEVKYCHLKINDLPMFRILPYLDKAADFINQAEINNGKILVHCQLGISRSTSCVIAYMIKYKGYNLSSALEFIRKKRPQVMPNYGFLEQLTIYEKNNIDNQKEEKINH